MFEQSCSYTPIVVLVLVISEVRIWFSGRGSAPSAPQPEDEYSSYCYYYNLADKNEVAVAVVEQETGFSSIWLLFVFVCIVAFWYFNRQPERRGRVLYIGRV